MADAPPRPIADAELADIFATLERLKPDHVMLAVSGGTDSLALLHLYADYHRLTARPARVLVVTVDHRLRPESATEATIVAHAARRLGFAHETLVWVGAKPPSGRQQAARDARYRLMAKRLASEPGSRRAILTAHTQDDQAETFLMRLARGSGLDGLAAMAPVRELEQGRDIHLVRPLLGVTRARLAATLAARNVTPLEDPGNADPAYERVRVRAMLTDLARLGMPPEALARSANRLARARNALEALTRDQEASVAAIWPGLATTFGGPAFWVAPAEIRLRLLARALNRHRGAHPAARLMEIEDALAHLERAMAGGGTALTLGGCIVEVDQNSLSVFRELGREGLGEASLEPGTGAMWDDRFEVALSANAAAAVIVRALPPEFHRHAKAVPGASAVPSRALLTLPSFWCDGELIGFPPIAAWLSAKSLRHAVCIPLPDGSGGSADEAHRRFAAACSLTRGATSPATGMRNDELE